MFGQPGGMPKASTEGVMNKSSTLSMPPKKAAHNYAAM